MNDTERQQQQWTSGEGSLEHVALQELRHRQRPLWWLVGIGVLCLFFARSNTIGGVSNTPKEQPTGIRAWRDWLTAFIEEQSPVVLGLSSFVVFLTCSLWWQRSVFWSDGIPAVYHDALGSYWLIGRSGTWTGWLDASTGFPNGQNYASVDSYVLWAVSQMFAWLEPRMLYVLWVLLAPAVSASAAEWLAREWGVRSPWSLLAGMVFGFSGLMFNAVLEGQIYQTLLVGLPCTAIAVARYQRSPNRWSWLGIVLSVALCLFSSSYMGASCLLLLFGLWIGSQGWKKWSSLWVFLGVIPMLWVHYRLMSDGGLETREVLKVAIGSLSLENLWGSTPELDRERHAITVGLSTVAVMVSVSALVRIHQLQQWKKWLPILCAGGVSLVFALGPIWQVHIGSGVSIPPMVWLFEQPGFSSIGFPIRLAQPFILCVGVLAAFGLQHLANRHRWAWILLPLAFLQVESQDLVERQQFWSVEAPNLERVNGNAVFTLYPLVEERIQGTDADVVLYMQDCLAQVTHQRSIVHDCISVGVQDSTAKAIQRALLKNIAESKSVWPILAEYQIEHLVFYPEWFRGVDRIRVRRALATDSTMVDSGMHPLHYEVYQRQNNPIQPHPIKSTQEFEHATVQLDVWTSKEYTVPLLLLGEGLLVESTVQSFEQSVRHQFSLTDVALEMACLIQSTEGAVIWEGTLYPNPKSDHIQIREKYGVVMELPVLDSPPIQPNMKGFYWVECMLLLGFVGISVRQQWAPEITNDA